MATDRGRETSIFNAARMLGSREARASYLAEACGDDVALRDRVEKLLLEHIEESECLDQPAIGLDATIACEDDGNDRAASLQAGLTSAFSIDQAFLMGDPNHSVLRSLSVTLGAVPQVSLAEPPHEAPDPIVRPQSPEIPKPSSDSRYQLQGEIARGGMGAILKGRDTDLGRDLAIKVLLDVHKDNPQVIQRFIEEAQIGGQLQHPGIAPVYELGQFADQRPFFSMKLVKGQTLAKLLADRKDAAEERAKFIGIFEQVCQTMAYAHSRGVIHRDLKPANIMVGAFGEVQVMDWGLAKVLPSGGVADEKHAKQKQQGQSIIQTMRSMGSDAPGSFGSHGSGSADTQMGSVMGTPAYMPPEQALGEIDQLDRRADVFGLGAILAEILTGKPPYVGDNGTQVYRLASRGKLEDCFQRLDACGADQDLIALTKHCLELEPSDRPKDAGVFAGRVTEYIESVEKKLRETELQRATEVARVMEQKKRLRVTLALAAAVLTILLGGGSFAWWQNQQRQLVLQRQARNAEAVASLIDQTIEALQSNDTAKAAIALKAAQQRSEEGGAEQYASRLVLLHSDLQLLKELDAVDQYQWTWQSEAFTPELETALRVKQALRGLGIDIDTTSSADVVARVAQSVQRERIIAALDRLVWLEGSQNSLAVIKALDSDSFRTALRQSICSRDNKRLTELAESEEALNQSNAFVAFLGGVRAIPKDRRRVILDVAIRREPQDMALLMILTTGDFLDTSDEELRWTQSAVAAAPDNIAAIINLAVALHNSKRHQESVGWYQKAIEIDPSNARVHSNLAKCLYEIGDVDGAVAGYRRALDLEPRNSTCYTNLGAVLCDGKRDYDGAIESFGKAIELAPEEPANYFNRGIAHLGKSDFAKTISDFKTMVELAPDELNFCINCVWALATHPDKDGRFAHVAPSIVWLEDALKHSPNDPTLHLALGLARYRTSHRQEAIEALARAIELDGDNPDQPSAWLLLAMSTWELDQKDKAKEWYEKANLWRSKNESEVTEYLSTFFKEAASQMGSAPSIESESTGEPK